MGLSNKRSCWGGGKETGAEHKCGTCAYEQNAWREHSESDGMCVGCGWEGSIGLSNKRSCSWGGKETGGEHKCKTYAYE